MSLRRQLEFALVLIALGVAAWFIRGRFDDIEREARRVQVRMAAESALTNAALLHMQCPATDDTECLRRALSRLQRARVTGPATPEAARLPAHLQGMAARLWAVALASGAVPQEQGGRWALQEAPPDGLWVGLNHVTDCRFLLRIHLKSGSASVEDKLLTC